MQEHSITGKDYYIVFGAENIVQTSQKFYTNSDKMTKKENPVLEARPTPKWLTVFTPWGVNIYFSDFTLIFQISRLKVSTKFVLLMMKSTF